MNICSYPRLKTIELVGINKRFKLLFDYVCFLLAQGGGGGGTYTVDNGLTPNTATNFQWGGALTGNTTITAGTNLIVFTGANTTSATLGVANTSGINGSISISGIGTGASRGVQGESGSGNGMYGISNSGTGILGTSVSGLGAVGVSTSSTGVAGSSVDGLGGAFTVNPSSTNSIVSIARAVRATSGTAADGLGGSLDIYLQASGSTTPVLGNSLISKWTTANTGTRVSEFSITGVNNTNETTLLTIAGRGDVKFNTYGQGDYTAGTPVYALNVDSSGNVLEGSLGGGGNTIYTSDDNIITNRTVDVDGNFLTFVNGADTLFSIDPSTGQNILSTTDGTSTSLLDLIGLGAFPYFHIASSDGSNVVGITGTPDTGIVTHDAITHAFNGTMLTVSSGGVDTISLDPANSTAFGNIVWNGGGGYYGAISGQAADGDSLVYLATPTSNSYLKAAEQGSESLSELFISHNTGGGDASGLVFLSPANTGATPFVLKSVIEASGNILEVSNASTSLFKIDFSGKISTSGLQVFANNAAALSGGLLVNDWYYSNVAGDGILKIVI